MIKDVVFSAGLPYALYLLLSSQGASTVTALAASGALSAAYTVYGIVRERRVHALAVIVLAATVASIAATLAFDSPYFALAKGSLLTGSIAVAFAGSLLLRRPLVFHLALIGQDEGARAEAEDLWGTQPRYRTIMRRLTLAWALALVVEATSRILLIPVLPVAVFLVVSEALWIVAFAAMTAFSWWYGGREIEKLVELKPVQPAAPPVV
ncbi:MAG TPA: VC0807 family protein [Acetobacteraceae bacterium]|jgi:hypothetical protein|nr:VC0807 family protein [Acetobacteraceae bacterium]